MEQIHVFSSQNLESYFVLLAKVLVGAFIAFFMEVAEVLVVTYTSSLTLSIAGIGKVSIRVHLGLVEWHPHNYFE